MMIKFLKVIILASLSINASAQSMNFDQVLQQVIDHYPSIKTAAYQVERAKQENRKIESQLGWQLNSQAGFTREVSAFGTPTDSVRLFAGLTRQLKSGATLGVDAAINKDDASTVFSPTLPNPVTTTSLNLNYRHPFEKGSDNPAYSQGLESASAGIDVANAERKAIYDQLAAQVIELYLGAAVTQARIKNIEQSIVRSKRLRKYIKNRLDLGVSEDKDILQVEAQLKGQQAEREGLLMAWKKQEISLNRLMGAKWDESFKPVTKAAISLPDESQAVLFEQVKLHSPSLLSVKGQLKLAESAIKTRRDAKQDNLDLVMFVGNRTNDGDTIIGNTSESEVVGGVRLEFNRGLDKSGFDADLYQSQIDRGVALQNQKQVLEDLQYELSSLLAEIKSGQSALKAYKRSASSEKKKLNEAELRYKKGRADTDQLILFESQLSLAELSIDLQKIELLRRFHSLNLLRGELWKTIHVPEVSMGFKQEMIKK
jgi:outer membrane protein TolC